MVYYHIGTGISMVNGIAFDYMPNTYVIIPSGVMHSERALTDTNLYIFGFDMAKSDFTLPNTLFFDSSKQILDEIERMLAEYSDNRPFMHHKLSNNFQNLLIDTLRSCTKAETNIDDKLEMLVNYIDNYATTDINFQNLANSMSYSYDYLRHYFKQKKGISLKQYVLNKRIEAVKRLLITDLPIGEIAANCGFYSTAHMSNTFFTQVGMSPSAYRKKRADELRTCDTIPLPDSMPPCFTGSSLRSSAPKKNK